MSVVPSSNILSIDCFTSVCYSIIDRIVYNKSIGGFTIKKEEKTKLTYEKILSAAIAEFGTKNYDAASISAVCNENQISKGLLYHNFKSKDELYLRCVEACFHEMTKYLHNADYKADTIQGSLKKLLAQRHKFFSENPYFSNIFFNAILQPPLHLRNNIREIRCKFDDFYIICYRDLLEKIPLRDGITPDMAREYFMIFEEMFNGYFQNKAYTENDFHSFIDEHEINLSKILDIMLYGIAQKEDFEKKL